jgi:hypothetical protein
VVCNFHFGCNSKNIVNSSVAFPLAETTIAIFSCFILPSIIKLYWCLLRLKIYHQILLFSSAFILKTTSNKLSNCSYSIKRHRARVVSQSAIEYIIFKFSNFVVGISILLRSKNKSELIPTMYMLASTFEIIDSKDSLFEWYLSF